MSVRGKPDRIASIRVSGEIKLSRDNGKRCKASAAAHTEEGDLLDRPIADLAPNLLDELSDSLDEATEPSFAGRQVGAYRLLGVLGRGGMGVVYEAERADAQFEKRVAIKFMPRGLESPELKRRFRVERQILADLEHPAIARLIDGGMTDEGFPYLVIDLVEGRKIDRFCDEECLPLRARLRLFLQVCEAVQYAHQKLVVHRDLKPGNILVTGDGKPKLLDFGVAKLLQEEDLQRTQIQPVTPHYAAPEQLANQPVTAASDVYSLGVILFELLTGSSFNRQDGRTAGEDEPIMAQPPSQAVDAGKTGETAGRTRLARQLEGDLDNIVLKALRQEPERRYATVEAMAGDIARYLSGLPITARPSTVQYRTRKFVGRHRLGVSMASLTLVLLVAGVAGVVYQGTVARHERDRAEQVARFVTDMMRISDPDLGEGTTITARELLDRSRLKAEQELAGQPEIQTRVLSVIAEGYLNLGINDLAAEVLQGVVNRLRAGLPETIESLALRERQLGEVLAASGRPDAGFAHFQEALDLRAANFAAPDSVLASTLVDYASAMGYHLPTTDPRRQQIEPMLRRAIAISKAANDGDSPVLSSALHLLGQELNTQSLSGDSIDETLARESERYMRNALAMKRRLFGDQSIEVAGTLNDLSLLIDNLGRKAEGADMMAEALEIHREMLGPEHPDSIMMTGNLGAFRFEQGRYTEAEALFRDCLVQWGKIHPADHLDMAPAIYWLARTLMALDDLDGAEAELQRVIVLFAQEKAETRINAARSTLGEVYLKRGEYERAEPLLLNSLAELQTLRGTMHPLTLQARDRVIRLLASTGRIAEAERVSGLPPTGNPNPAHDAHQ